MSAEERYCNNQKYLRAVFYMKRLFEKGIISKEQMRKAIRYFAEIFEPTIRIFI